MKTSAALFVAVLAVLSGLPADGKPAPSSSPIATATSVPTAAVKEETVVTHHALELDGRSVAYTATAGTILLRDDKDQATASVFYIAYTADGLGPPSQRPVTFLYNGGPGAGSALVNIGGFGPRMLPTPNAAAAGPPPYTMVDNPNTLLDASDLVFVDAVGTGFSRIVGKGTAKDFYGVTADGKAFVQFIRRYITRNDRWNSPKYLAGESYGTTRSAVVAKMLHDDGVDLSGIILTGTVLDFETLQPQPGNDLPYWLFLPTEAAVAAYYHKLPSDPTDLQDFLQSVRAFASGPYAAALAKGSQLGSAERNAIAQQLHADTGMPVDYWIRSDLRVRPGRFEKELLGSEERTVGRYDARFSEFDIDPISTSAKDDPTSDAIFGAFTAAFNHYVREELNFKTDEPYEFLSGSVNGQWDWKTGLSWGALAADVSPDLRDVMTENPHLRVFCAAGLYDMATPFYGAEYTLQHLGLNPALQSQITFGYYPTGHMVYLNPAAHAQLKRDLDAFYR